MNMKKLTAAVLSLLCLTLTACAKTPDDTHENLTEETSSTITEVTETEKVFVTSESETTESFAETMKTESITETSVETTSDANEASDEELDFWAWSGVEDGYIITDPADSLTLKKLYPLICKAFDYMLDSKKFYFSDENVYEEIDEYSAQEGEKYCEVFTQRFVDQIPKPNEEDVKRGYYVYSLGYLDEAGNGYGADRGVDLCYMASDWQIEVISETEVQLIHQAYYSLYPEWIEGDEPTYFKDHKLLNRADDSVHQLRTVDNRSERLETYYYTLLWEDGHWKFDNFSLWK